MTSRQAENDELVEAHRVGLPPGARGCSSRAANVVRSSSRKSDILMTASPPMGASPGVMMPLPLLMMPHSGVSCLPPQVHLLQDWLSRSRYARGGVVRIAYEYARA